MAVRRAPASSMKLMSTLRPSKKPFSLAMNRGPQPTHEFTDSLIGVVLEVLLVLVGPPVDLGWQPGLTTKAVRVDNSRAIIVALYVAALIKFLAFMPSLLSNSVLFLYRVRP